MLTFNDVARLECCMQQLCGNHLASSNVLVNKEFFPPATFIVVSCFINGSAVAEFSFSLSTTLSCF